MSTLKNRLSQEELEMEREALFGADRSASAARLDELRGSAQATLDERKKPVNIRLDPVDLAALKDRAAESGLGYQTLIASVLHRFIVGGLVDRQVVEEIRTAFSGTFGHGNGQGAKRVKRKKIEASRKTAGKVRKRA